MRPPSKRTPTDPSAISERMSWSTRQRLPLGVDELQLAGRSNEAADLVLIAARQAGDLDHDPTLAAAHLGPDLRLRHAEAADAALDDVARGLDLLVGDRLARLRGHRQRDPDAALQVQAQHRLHLAAEDVGGQPRQAERLSGEVDEDRQQQSDENHPRGDAAPGHMSARWTSRSGRRGCRRHQTRRTLAAGRASIGTPRWPRNLRPASPRGPDAPSGARPLRAESRVSRPAHRPMPPGSGARCRSA